MINFEGFRAYLYEEELSKNTIDSYLFGLKRYAEQYEEISKANVVEFKAYLNERFKPQTVNLRLSAVRKYCEYKGINLKIKEVKEPKKTHIDNIISDDQFRRVWLKYDMTRETVQNPFWYRNTKLVGDSKRDKSSIETTLRRLGKKAGVENVHPHRFRRTCATMALRRGMPLELVSKMLGHEQIATTQIYLDLSEHELEEAHKKYVV